jgi:saxitoxin biosynthesis operon SxtJ-like protein
MPLIDIRWNPSRRELRQFAGIWFPAFWGVAGGVGLYHAGRGALPVVSLIWAAAVVVSVVGYLKPSFMLPIFVAWMTLTAPVSWLVSHAVLGALYFLMIAPLGLAMRLLGRDPMARNLEPEAPSYWVEHRTGTDPRRYFRQF